MGGPAKGDLLSVGDDREGEKTAEVRHQLVDGEVFAMAGTTKARKLVSGNLYGLLRAAGWDLEVFGPQEAFRRDSVGAVIGVESVHAGVDPEPR